MRISDWSSDVCSSDLPAIAGEGIAVACIHHQRPRLAKRQGLTTPFHFGRRAFALSGYAGDASVLVQLHISEIAAIPCLVMRLGHAQGNARDPGQGGESSGGEGRFFHIASIRSEEHTSELQSLMSISYAVF